MATGYRLQIGVAVARDELWVGFVVTELRARTSRVNQAKAPWTYQQFVDQGVELIHVDRFSQQRNIANQRSLADLYGRLSHHVGILLVQPETVVNLREIPRLDTIVNDADGSLRIGSMATLASIADHPLVRRRYPAFAGAIAASASPQIRNMATLGGNLLQRPRCWYLRAAEYHCLRKGGDHCFAIYGENQYHAIFHNRPCTIVHPSTAATVLVALGATLQLSNANGVVRQSLLEEFFVTAQEDVTRENRLKSQEILAAIPTAAARGRCTNGSFYPQPTRTADSYQGIAEF